VCIQGVQEFAGVPLLSVVCRRMRDVTENSAVWCLLNRTSQAVLHM
jgi:uncharacterized membrane protein YhaH (DUF805 family)